MSEPRLTIVTDARPTYWSTLAESAIANLGVLLICAGVAAFGLAALDVYLFWGYEYVTGQSVPTWPALALSLLGICAITLGRRLAKRKRYQALFLRRFGFGESTMAVSSALKSAIGGRWRLVTLDDKAVASVGLPEGQRRIGRVGLFVAFALLAGLVWWAASGTFGRYVEAESMAWAMGSGMAGGIVRIVVQQVLYGALMALIALAVAATILLILIFHYVQRAERMQRLSISSAHDVNSTVAAIVRRKRNVFAPRMTVLDAPADVWRDVVKALTKSSSAVIVDVSEPSENVLWEIRYLREVDHPRPVFIGQGDRLEKLALGDKSPCVKEVVEALEGEDVLAYWVGADEDRKRFVRLLRSRLGG